MIKYKLSANNTNLTHYTTTFIFAFHSFPYKFSCFHFQQAAHARGAPQAFSFHSSTHTSASNTQPTMQLSFKFQSRNLRGQAISLQKLSDRSRTCCKRARHSISLFFLRVSLVAGRDDAQIAKLAGAGAAISLQTHACAGARDCSIANLCCIGKLRDRSRTCACTVQASRIRCEEVTCMLARV